jgi:hypothetical protein
MTAGHFSALLRGGNAWQTTYGTNAEAAKHFLSEYDARRVRWLTAWRDQDRAARTEPLAERAIAWLQWFDALSLWLCCAERRVPHTMTSPGGPSITLSPIVGGQIAVSPWPFSTDALTLETNGRAIPATRYADRATLSDAPSRTVSLRWRLRP